MLIYGLIILGMAGFHLKLMHMGQKSVETQVVHGIVDDSLRACGDKPNCVNSQTIDDSAHFIEPFVYNTSWQETKSKVSEYLNKKGYLIVEDTEDYIYATFESNFYHFVDDIEFYFLEDVLHFRSASRIGYSDLSANKNRVEDIKKHLSK